ATAFNSGGRYNPSNDSWTATSVSASTPSPRYSYTATWTGTEMIVWGGAATGTVNYLNSGGRYFPSTDTWIAMSGGDADVPSARYGHSAVWTGHELIVWGGSNAHNALNT